MTHSERQLLEILRQRSFQRGEFRLASGDVSNYYIDGRKTTVSSQGALLIGEVLYERTKDLEIDAIGGLAVGAVPLVTAAVVSYAQHGRTMEGFWVRDRAKDHGTKSAVEGNVRPGSKVVVVDDVFTRGNSTLKAVAEVRGIGCEVVLVLALVDRLCGAEEAFRAANVSRYQAVFTIRDFGVEA